MEELVCAEWFTKTPNQALQVTAFRCAGSPHLSFIVRPLVAAAMDRATKLSGWSKLMAWQYQLFAGDHVGNVLPLLCNFIKGLNKNEQMSAKAETTDARADQARGVVFYNPDVEYSPVPTMPGGTWSMETHSNVDPNVAFAKIAEKLNALSKEQAFYAKVVASDAQYQPCTAAIFWPEPA